MTNNNNTLINDIDSFLFYDEKWLFVENLDFFELIVDYMDIEIFFKIGSSIANKLNEENISVDDYDISYISEFVKNEE